MDFEKEKQTDLMPQAELVRDSDNKGKREKQETFLRVRGLTYGSELGAGHGTWSERPTFCS